MLQYFIRRLFMVIPVLIGVSLLVFLLVHITPGDPIRIMVGLDATPEEIDRIRTLYGFDQPLYIQYWQFISRAVFGDLGMSIRQHMPVTTLIFERFPATLELTITALFIAVIFAIPLGVLAATKQHSWLDISSMSLALVGVSMPGFWLGLILLIYVALPSSFFGMFGRGPAFLEGVRVLLFRFDPSVILDSLRYLLLPAISMGAVLAGLITRLTRNCLLEILKQDYIRTAQAKGLAKRVVIYKHALRNALLPIITVVGLQLGILIGGAVIIEVVFSWPGMGRMIIEAIRRRDFPLLQGSVLMMAVVFVLINLTVDILYALINPKIRYD